MREKKRREPGDLEEIRETRYKRVNIRGRFKDDIVEKRKAKVFRCSIGQ